MLFSYATQEWQLSTDDSFDVDGIAIHFVYRFQLQLVKNFGYYLGTRLGASYYFPATRRSFHTWLLPGAAMGIVWYVNPMWQVLLGGEVFLERVPRLPTPDKELKDFSLVSYGALLVLERYFTLNTAITAAVVFGMTRHELQHRYDAYVTDFYRRSLHARLGINYHLL